MALGKQCLSEKAGVTSVPNVLSGCLAYIYSAAALEIDFYHHCKKSQRHPTLIHMGMINQSTDDNEVGTYSQIKGRVLCFLNLIFGAKKL